MERKLLSFLTVFAMVIGLIGAQLYTINVDAAEENEVREEDEVVEISTLTELEAFRDSVNGGESYRGQTVILTADIDMSEKYGENIDGEEVSWTPIGKIYDEGGEFDGTFDGGGHEIKGLYINTSSWYQGLFSILAEGATVKNLGVSGKVSGRAPVGGIAGYNRKGATISGCYNMTTITGDGQFRIGGITGANSGTLENCYNTGKIAGADESYVQIIGGVAGSNNADAVIKNCYNIGTVSGKNNFIGGIVGENEGYLENCYNTGIVMGHDTTGGIVGNNKGKVHYCYNKGYISEIDDHGGEIGGVIGINKGSVENCYNTGDVSGNLYIGGVVGTNKSFVANCYNTGRILGNAGIGGVIGENYDGSIVESCYYLQGTASGGIDGADTENAMQKSAADFANQSTFYDWDFNADWVMSDLLGRPVLRSIMEEATGPAPVRYGDLDKNGAVEVDDALIVLKYAAGLVQLDDEARKYADVNADNNVDVDDALDILKKCAGLLDYFKADMLNGKNAV